MQGVDYASGQAPPDYRCGTCDAHGCKLWRPAHGIELRCVACAEQKAGERLDVFACSGVDQIGAWLPAVPDEEGVSFWGYTSVPRAGVAWWRGLPMALPASHRVEPTDADIAREFWRRFGPTEILIGKRGPRSAYAELDGDVWWSGAPGMCGAVTEHAAGEDGFVAALERARELVRRGG